MRVLFDHQVFSWQAYGGISRYFFEIASGLNESGEQALFPAGFFSENVYLRSMPGLNAASLSAFNFPGKKWLQERLGRAPSLKALRNSSPDVFHPTYFDDYFVATASKRSIPFVLTIHDMIHEKYAHGKKGFFSLDANVIENKQRLAQKAGAIVVVSEHTRQDVLQYIPDIDPSKIHTIHHGNSMPVIDGARKNTLTLPDRYLLFVGQRGAYKNFRWMLEQLSDLLCSDASLHLVCVGGAAFDAGEKAYFASKGLTDKVFHPSIRTDVELAELYARARCFIFPSRYEGFGLPVLEAFSCGCPCVLNAVSSLPEVGGDASLYFNDNEGEALVNAVNGLLHDQNLRDSLIKKGYDRVQQFTWQKSVEAHRIVYQSLI